jgi:hypothetical protein
VTTPRPAPPSTFEEYFQQKYDQAVAALSQATAHLERKTLDLKYLSEEVEHSRQWFDTAKATVEAMEREGHLVDEEEDSDA